VRNEQRQFANSTMRAQRSLKEGNCEVLGSKKETSRGINREREKNRIE